MEVFVVCELRLKKEEIDSYYWPSKFKICDLWKVVTSKEEAEKMLDDWAKYQEEEMGGIERYNSDLGKYVPIWVGEPVKKRMQGVDDQARDWEIATFENYPEYLTGYTKMSIRLNEFVRNK